MADLDHLLDDALAGFDDEEQAPPPAAAAARSSSPAPQQQQQQQQQAQQPAVPVQQSTPAAPSSAPAASQSTPAAAAAAAAADKKQGRMAFDPLKRNKGPAGSSKAAGSSSRPALTPEIDRLQEDLAALMNEWSQAMHPEEAAEASPAAASSQQQQQQQRGVASVLQALQEQTQRTVEQQARARPPPAAAAGAAGAGEEQQQMSMIVDVVMQHLLSKDVLYQPMKEIADKYPPWLEKQAAAGSSSTLSPADMERYRRQYDCIKRLCAAYESDPGNTANIMGLLQEMQACGEPPDDIVADMTNTIAADLPGLGGAGAAGLAGGSGLGDLNFDDLDLGGLADTPDLKNCPVQ